MNFMQLVTNEIYAEIGGEEASMFTDFLLSQEENDILEMMSITFIHSLIFNYFIDNELLSDSISKLSDADQSFIDHVEKMFKRVEEDKTVNSVLLLEKEEYKKGLDTIKGDILNMFNMTDYKLQLSKTAPMFYYVLEQLYGGDDEDYE